MQFGKIHVQKFIPTCLCFSRESSGHDELRRGEGQAHQDHVVTARPVTPQVRRGKRLHQKSGQVHWQQGPVRHLLSLREHPVLQGRTIDLLSLWANSYHTTCCLIKKKSCVNIPLLSTVIKLTRFPPAGGVRWERIQRLRICALWDAGCCWPRHREDEWHAAERPQGVSVHAGGRGCGDWAGLSAQHCLLTWVSEMESFPIVLYWIGENNLGKLYHLAIQSKYSLPTHQDLFSIIIKVFNLILTW